MFCLCQPILCIPKSRYIPDALKPGNRSVKRSSESTPTSPFMRSSSSRRAEVAGRSTRRLRRLLRGCGTPFGASIVYLEEIVSRSRDVSSNGSCALVVACSSRTAAKPKSCTSACCSEKGSVLHRGPNISYQSTWKKQSCFKSAFLACDHSAPVCLLHVFTCCGAAQRPHLIGP
jgi:hypothetical protein